MNLKNKPPLFVPRQFQSEIEKLSKAALMDMVWDLATRAAGADELAVNEIMGEVRHTAEIINNYRNDPGSTMEGSDVGTRRLIDRS
jgi:hypothetical protein